MRNGKVDWLLLLATLVAGQPSPEQHAHLQASLATPPPGTATTYTPPTTCESRAINYLTHTLPQQCLDTAIWSSTARTSGSSEASPSATSLLVSEDASLVISTDNTRTVEETPSSATQAPTTSSTSDAPRPTTSAASPEAASPLPDAETESVLDNAQFLSFEDWKKQNAPQKQEHPRRSGAATVNKRARPGANQALEGLGDEAEIEIDFAGFRATEQPGTEPRRPQTGMVRDAPLAADAVEEKPDLTVVRSKDAGKTCKERFNYASFDCAATVLKTNEKVKHASSILVENKDTYMTSECSVDNRFVIVELCEDILIDTVVLANYEFFASSFHSFRVSASETYPVRMDKWKTLGTFEAKNTREIQPFLVENPQIFARYIRIEFLTHYGNQYYCPLSLLRVHGMTMFEQWKLEQIENPGHAGGADAAEEDHALLDAPLEETLAPSPSNSTDTPAVSENHTVPAADKEQPLETKKGDPSAAPAVPPATPEISTNQSKPAETATPVGVCSTPSLTLAMELSSNTASKCPSSAVVTSGPSSSNSTTAASTPASSDQPSSTQQVTSHHTTPQQIETESGPSHPPATSITGSVTAAVTNTTTMDVVVATTSEPSSPSIKTQQASPSSPLPAAASTAIVASSASSAPAAHPPSAPPSPSAPATQESFFKSIHKRLQALESNSTLSMEYIESQSQILREAFAKIDKRNIAKTSEFLERLNSTVIAELSRFKSDYEQLWQSTVLELASQRDEGRREREILSEQVKLLAGEVVSQKRLQAAQATLLLVCLGFVIFGRGGAGGVVDTALIQNVQGFVAKQRQRRHSISIGRKWPWESPWMSPPDTRPTSRRGHARSSSVELDGADAVDSPAAPESSEEGEREPARQNHAARLALLETHSAPTTPQRERELELRVQNTPEEARR